MKHLLINIFAFLVIIIGSSILTNTTNAYSNSAMTTVILQDRCGKCSTDDPDKCCKKGVFGKCKTFPC